MGWATEAGEGSGHTPARRARPPHAVDLRGETLILFFKLLASQ